MRWVLVLAATLSATGFLEAQCNTPNGLSLGVFTSGTLGNPFTVQLAGTPGVSGILGADTSPGPVMTSIGTVCLGLSSSLLLTPFTLDLAGSFSLGGIEPPDPYLNGVTEFLQAAASDPSQPSGIAISNAVSATLRSPRLFFVDYGYSGSPAKWCAYDVLLDVVTTPVIPLPYWASDAILIPGLGWIAFLLTNGMVVCFDTTTTAQTLSFQAIPSPFNPERLAVDGTILYLVYSGYSPTGNVPGAVRSVSLPSGANGFFAPLPAGNPIELMPVGGGIAYLRSGGSAVSVIPLDVINGYALAPILLGSASGNVGGWIRQGARVYCLRSGSLAVPAIGLPATPVLLDVIDTTTHALVNPAPVVVSPDGGGSLMGLGPGILPSTLIIYTVANYLVPTYNTLYQVDPSTLQVVGINPVPTLSINTMTLSAGGTEWLANCSGFNCPLSVLHPPTLTQTILGTLPSGLDVLQTLVTSSSATLRKSYTVYKQYSSSMYYVVPIPTDPAAAPSYVVPLPAGLGPNVPLPLRCLVD